MTVRNVGLAALVAAGKGLTVYLSLPDSGGKGFPLLLEGASMAVELKQIVRQAPHLPLGRYVLIAS